MVIMDFLIYPNILLKSLEGLNSSFVLIATCVIGIFSLPACTIVSNVYVYSLVTFILNAASLLIALKPLGASGISVFEATLTTQLPKC